MLTDKLGNDRFVFFPSEIGMKLLNEKSKIKTTGRASIYKDLVSDKTIVVCLVQSNHFLLCVLTPEEEGRRIQLVDSLSNGRKERCFKFGGIIRNKLESLGIMVTDVEEVNVQTQANYHDCGVFAILFAQSIILDRKSVV